MSQPENSLSEGPVARDRLCLEKSHARRPTLCGAGRDCIRAAEYSLSGALCRTPVTHICIEEDLRGMIPRGAGLLQSLKPAYNSSRA